MAELKQAFNPAEVEDNYSLLPPAPYALAVTKTSSKPSGKNPGATVYTIEMDVQGGQYQGRKVFEQLNLDHPNEQPRNIANATLKRLCEACGGKVIKDLDELIGIPFIGHVAVKEGDLKDKNNPQGERYNDKNVIKKYEKLPNHASTPVSAAAPW